MKIRNYLIVFTLLNLLVLSACKKEPHFEISGDITNAAGESIYLFKRGLTDITIADSTKISDDGKFLFKQAAEEYPELYILVLDNQPINLAVDSTEKINIQADKANFAFNYQIEGSESSSKMREIVMAQHALSKKFTTLKKQNSNKEIADQDFFDKSYEAINEYKDIAKEFIFNDLKSPAAYFALFQRVDDYLIFDPYNKDESKIFIALATSWDLYYKDSPRTKHLKEFALGAMKEVRSTQKKIEMIQNAQESGNTDYYNIELPDIRHTKVSLSSLKGKVVILDFTAYEAEYSPLHNIAINKLYEKYGNKIAIYQVSFDTDLNFWQNAALNLPWICVRDANSLSSELIGKYNIQQLPTTFIIDKEGEIGKRLDLSEDWEKEVAKFF